jgi:hypothetical protein
LPGTQSKKHQQRDHGSLRGHWSFCNCYKNTRYNLLRKISELRKQEHLEDQGAKLLIGTDNGIGTVA